MWGLCFFRRRKEGRKNRKKKGARKNERRDRVREGGREEGKKKESRKILQALFLLSFFYYEAWPMRDYMVLTNTLRRVTLKYLPLTIWKWRNKREELWEFSGNLEIWQQAMGLGKLCLFHGSSSRRGILKSLLSQERQPWKLCSSLKFFCFFKCSL